MLDAALAARRWKGSSMVATRSYREIKADMLRRITGGEWPPGSLLPNETHLAQEYGSARATINRAMRELVEDGLVERKRKAGSRVRLLPLRQMRLDIPLVRNEIEEQGAEYRYALVRSDILKAPDWLRARLNLDADTQLRHVTCVHFADGQPYQFEDRWINLKATPGARIADFGATGPNEWLVRQVPFSNVEVSFSANSATPEQAQHLGCAPGDSLFQIERQTFWQGQSVTFVRLLYHRGYRMTTRY